MIHIRSDTTIHAPRPLVMGIYMDYANWPELFSLTIRSVRCVKQQNGVITLEVDHKKEGIVINQLTVLSSEEIKLEEWKSKYNASFINRFEPMANATRYTVTAHISLKGVYRLATPFIKHIVKSRIRKFVLEPVKRFSETEEKTK